MALPSVAQMEAYIRQKAVELGIDPDTAVRVARSEGLKDGTWQATGNLDYGREQSYGPFQLHVAPKGYRQGMGNDFVNATGLDPSDPGNWQQGVDFALGRAKKGGWSPWMGAKKIGITGMMGIGGKPAEPAQATQTAKYSAGEYVPSFDYSPTPGLLDDAPTWIESNGADLADIGLNIIDKANKKKKAQAQEPMPQASVLQPLRRFTMEGLL